MNSSLFFPSVFLYRFSHTRLCHLQWSLAVSSSLVVPDPGLKKDPKRLCVSWLSSPACLAGWDGDCQTVIQSLPHSSATSNVALAPSPSVSRSLPPSLFLATFLAPSLGLLTYPVDWGEPIAVALTFVKSMSEEELGNVRTALKPAVFHRPMVNQSGGLIDSRV